MQSPTSSISSFRRFMNYCIELTGCSSQSSSDTDTEDVTKADPESSSNETHQSSLRCTVSNSSTPQLDVASRTEAVDAVIEKSRLSSSNVDDDRQLLANRLMSWIAHVTGPSVMKTIEEESVAGVDIGEAANYSFSASTVFRKSQYHSIPSRRSSGRDVYSGSSQSYADVDDNGDQKFFNNYYFDDDVEEQPLSLAGGRPKSSQHAAIHSPSTSSRSSISSSSFSCTSFNDSQSCSSCCRPDFHKTVARFGLVGYAILPYVKCTLCQIRKQMRRHMNEAKFRRVEKRILESVKCALSECKKQVRRHTFDWHQPDVLKTEARFGPVDYFILDSGFSFDRLIFGTDDHHPDPTIEKQIRRHEMGWHQPDVNETEDIFGPVEYCMVESTKCTLRETKKQMRRHMNEAKFRTVEKSIIETTKRILIEGKKEIILRRTMG